MADDKGKPVPCERCTELERELRAKNGMVGALVALAVLLFIMTYAIVERYPFPWCW